MGSRAHATGREHGLGKRGRFVLALSTAIVGLLALAQTASATFHLVSIREVYPGSIAAPDSSYVELQMYNPGQNHVATHSVILYNAAGTQIGSPFTFPANLTPPAEGVNQETMLVGDTGVQAAFGVTPDLTSSSFNVPAAGGAACWDAIDCVAWGNYTGMGLVVGTPVDGSGGIPNTKAIKRKITGGTCTNLLDGADDTNDSAADFADATPAPVSYSTVPSPPACTPVSPPPTAIIDTKPPLVTNSEGAMAFTFHSEPPGAGFECRIDSEAFADCDSGSASYPGPVASGSHTFQVKASNANGTGSPANYTWTIDRTAPTVTIDTPKPVNPNSGTNVTFKYHASESSPTFECSMVKEGQPDAFSNCGSTSTKTYPKLLTGNYVFKVLAIDQAGNAGAPTEFPLVVDNTLADTTPPETTIKAKPPDPSSSTTAEFTYESNEASSTFQCKLDAAAFASCSASGIAYTGLGEGQHTFQVRATDTSANTDLSPAGYTFSVVLPVNLPQIKPPESTTPPPPPAAPETTITSKPKATTRDRTPTLKFSSPSAGATFECQLDGKVFRACRSPLTTKTLSFGRHTLKVRAVLPGALDPTPAGCSFKVVKPK